MRKMWAASAWQQRSPERDACWSLKRDDKAVKHSGVYYFTDVERGTHCGDNWYEGAGGNLGERDKPPSFTANAPALFGFDDAIDSYCEWQQHANQWYEATIRHPLTCVASNLNILALYGTRLQYNVCRNLEWQVCAARGELPGQRGPHVVFAVAPKTLDPGPNSPRPFGQCRGWREWGSEHDCSRGYATDDIFFLEVCIFNQICTNNHELFELEVGQQWQCEFSASRFRELEALLLETPDWAEPKGMPPPCAAFCNAWSCSQPECSGCQHPSLTWRNIKCN